MEDAEIIGGWGSEWLIVYEWLKSNVHTGAHHSNMHQDLNWRNWYYKVKNFDNIWVDGRLRKSPNSIIVVLNLEKDFWAWDGKRASLQMTRKAVEGVHCFGSEGKVSWRLVHIFKRDMMTPYIFSFWETWKVGGLLPWEEMSSWFRSNWGV